MPQEQLLVGSQKEFQFDGLRWLSALQNIYCILQATSAAICSLVPRPLAYKKLLLWHTTKNDFSKSHLHGKVNVGVTWTWLPVPACSHHLILSCCAPAHSTSKCYCCTHSTSKCYCCTHSTSKCYCCTHSTSGLGTRLLLFAVRLFLHEGRIAAAGPPGPSMALKMVPPRRKQSHYLKPNMNYTVTTERDSLLK